MVTAAVAHSNSSQAVRPNKSQSKNRDRGSNLLKLRRILTRSILRAPIEKTIKAMYLTPLPPLPEAPSGVQLTPFQPQQSHFPNTEFHHYTLPFYIISHLGKGAALDWIF